MAKKVLIIDDEAAARELLQNRLSASGYEAYDAEGPVSGFELIQKHLPDLIILNVLMPEMTGYEFVQALKKAKQEIRDIPIIVISGRQSMKDFFKSWEIFGFLLKPFDSAKLMSLVDSALKGADAAAESDEESSESAPAAEPAALKGDLLVVTSDDFVSGKLKELFAKYHYGIRATPEDSDALKQAAEKPPTATLVEYVENAAGLDAQKIKDGLTANETTGKLPFWVYCKKQLGVDAVRKFGQANVVIYDKTDELVDKMENLIKTRLGAA